MSADVAEALAALAAFHCEPPAAVPRSPFAWIVWENAAYLVDDERRLAVFRAIEQKTRLEPARLLALPDEALLALVKDGGMQPMGRVEKLRRCAALALELGGDDLSALLALPMKAARAALKRFPGIADASADRILLAGGVATSPSVESNGLRVLQRLGVVDGRTYAAQYRAAVAVLAAELPADAPGLVRARELLHRHGATLCRRTAPACPACPLAAACPAGGGA